MMCSHCMSALVYSIQNASELTEFGDIKNLTSGTFRGP